MDYKVASISPSTINLRLDRIIQKNFVIEPVVKGVSIPPDYMLGEVLSSEASVMVTGPAFELEKVESAVAVLELRESLTSSYVADVPIVLLDEMGKEINQEASHLTMNLHEVTIRQPVLLIKELPLQVGFINIPKGGFPVGELREDMALSHETLMVAGPVADMEAMTELNLGYIDIRTLADNNNIFPFEVILPSDKFININSVSSVTVDFDADDWASTVFTGIDNIQVFNRPAGYEVNLLTTTLSPVVFVGDENVIEEMTLDDIVVELDLSEKELPEAQGRYPVRISVPTKGLVWAVGDHTVILDVVKLAEE